MTANHPQEPVTVTDKRRIDPETGEVRHVPSGATASGGASSSGAPVGQAAPPSSQVGGARPNRRPAGVGEGVPLPPEPPDDDIPPDDEEAMLAEISQAHILRQLVAHDRRRSGAAEHLTAVCERQQAGYAV